MNISSLKYENIQKILNSNYRINLNSDSDVIGKINRSYEDKANIISSSEFKLLGDYHRFPPNLLKCCMKITKTFNKNTNNYKNIQKNYKADYIESCKKIQKSATPNQKEITADTRRWHARSKNYNNKFKKNLQIQERASI